MSQLEQPSSLDANQKLEDARKIEAAIDPLKKCIIRGLLQHRDKDVKLLVAICVSETFRILAPDLPFEDEYLRVKTLSLSYSYVVCAYHVRRIYEYFSFNTLSFS